MAPMDHSGFPLSSAHRTREQDTCTNIPNEILHDSAARAKYIRARMTEFVRPQSLLWLVKMGERAQFDWQAGSVHCSVTDAHEL